jgi:hypothetical protein
VLRPAVVSRLVLDARDEQIEKWLSDLLPMAKVYREARSLGLKKWQVDQSVERIRARWQKEVNQDKSSWKMMTINRLGQAVRDLTTEAERRRVATINLARKRAYADAKRKAEKEGVDFDPAMVDFDPDLVDVTRIRTDYKALAEIESLLADVQGTKDPIKIDVNVDIQAAVMSIVGSMSPEAMDQALSEVLEAKRLAGLSEDPSLVQAPTLVIASAAHASICICNLHWTKQVPASAHGGAYVVTFAEGHYLCTCPDYTYRSGPQARMCKHIIAVMKDRCTWNEVRDPKATSHLPGKCPQCGSATVLVPVLVPAT